jgi:DNA-binding transcriptional ArsR family regulator
MGLPDQRDFHATSAEDVHKVFDCWARLDVLVALSGPSRAVHDLAEAMGKGRTNVSAHLQSLRESGLAVSEGKGKERIHRLTSCMRITVTREGLLIEASANDGCRVSLFVAAESDAIRHFRGGLSARTESLIIQVPKRGSELFPKGRKKQPRYRPTEQ